MKVILSLGIVEPSWVIRRRLTKCAASWKSMTTPFLLVNQANCPGVPSDGRLDDAIQLVLCPPEMAFQ
eukprot:2668483-Pyramimonas_sp.AAC.1